MGFGRTSVDSLLNRKYNILAQNARASLIRANAAA